MSIHVAQLDSETDRAVRIPRVEHASVDLTDMLRIRERCHKGCPPAFVAG